MALNASRPPEIATARGRTFAAWFLVCLTYVIGSIVFLWPMPASIATQVWGDRFDAWTTLWLIDHLHHHIADGTLSEVTTDILFPFGYNLWSFGHALLQALGVGLMFLGIPLVTAYNLLLIGGFATSGIAAHMLGRALSADHRGGFVAGIVFATSPYLYGEGAAGCIELVAAGLLPLYALTLVHIAREPGWRTGLVSALVLALVGPFNWYYTLFAGMLGLGMVAWQLLEFRFRGAVCMLVAIAVAAGLDAPLIPLVRRETPTRPSLSTALFEDEAAWIEKNRVSDGRMPLADLTERMLEDHDSMQVIENATTVEALGLARFTVNPLQSTPGMIAFGVGIIGTVIARRRGAGWALIAVGATLLTLGPFLRVDETPPLPQWSVNAKLPYYYAYQYLPFFSKAYRPYRIGVITLTCCAALGAVGMAVLATEVRRQWLNLGTAVLGLAAVTQPFWSGDRPAARPLTDAAIPEIYSQLREQPEGAVVEIPLQYQPLTVANARFQYNQIAHRHPTLNCNQLIRRTDLMAFQKYVTANAFLSTLVDIGRRAPPYQFTADDVAAARKDGFRYIVLHTTAEADDTRLSGNEASADFVGQPAVEMLHTLFGDPILADVGTQIFQIPDALPTPTGKGPSYTWTGEDVADIDLPLDDKHLGLALPLAAGASMQVWEGPAREIAFWARPEQGEGLVVRIHSATGDRDVPVELIAQHWRWVQVPVPETGPVTIALAAGDTATSVRFTRVQVLK